MQRNSNFLFRRILSTPVITTDPASKVKLYCALNKENCRAYILSAKSFLRFYPDVAVIVQSDGSLDDTCVQEIKDSIKGSIVYSKEDMMKNISEKADSQLLGLIPGAEKYEEATSVKIMYLKFLNVIFRFNGEKVVIIDSDLIFIRPPEEIIQWIKEPYSHDFYGEGSNERAEKYYKMGFQFTSLDVANFSSGTIGVGGTVSQEELVEIFQRIQKHGPAVFYAWELEQALWAIVMSRRDNPLNLDELREVYIGSGWRPYHELREKAILAHFAGAFRFKNFRYLRLARDVMDEMCDTH